MATFVGVFVIGYMVLMDAVTTVYFVEEHGLSEEKAGTASYLMCLGYLFSITYLSYPISYLVYPFIPMKPRAFIFLSLFSTSLMILLLYGPSQHLPFLPK